MKKLKLIKDYIKNHKVVFSAIFLLMITMIFLVGFYLKNIDNSKYDNTIYENGSCSGKYEFAKNGDKVIQNLDIRGKTVSMIGLRLSNPDQINDFTIKITLSSSDGIIQQWDVTSGNINETGYLFINLNEKVKDIVCSLNIEMTNILDDGKIYVYSGKKNSSDNTETYYCDKKIDEDISLALIGKADKAISSIYIFICILIIIVVSLQIIMIWSPNRIKLEYIFIVSMILWGIIYTIALPPYTTADEESHMSTAYKISNSILGKDNVNEDGLIKIREEDDLLGFGHYLDSTYYINTYDGIFDEGKDTSEILYKHKPLNTPIIAHLPCAIGITLARIMNVNGITLVYIGRFFQIVFYSILIFTAIKIAPVKKMIFYTVSMIPTLLELISSYSYDAVINGLGMLTVAYILKLKYSEQKVKWNNIIVLVILISLLSPCKMIYSLIGFVIFIIPKEKFNVKHGKKIAVCIVLLTVIFTNIFTNLTSVVSKTGVAESTGVISYYGKPAYTVMGLLENPKQIISICYNTLVDNGEFYFLSTIGRWLGWHEIPISMIPIGIIIGMLAIVALMDEKNGQKKEVITLKNRMFLFVVGISIIILACVAMLLSWTPVGMEAIQGVQGRYFLPAIPLLLLSIKCKKIEIKNLTNLVIMALSFANIMVILDVLKFALK